MNDEGDFAHGISDPGLEELIKNYGLITGLSDLRSDLSKKLIESTNSLVSLFDFYDRIYSIKGNLREIIKSNEIKNLPELFLKYYDSTNDKLNSQLESVVYSSVDINPCDFGFILDIVKDNLDYAVYNYELSESDIVIFLGGGAVFSAELNDVSDFESVDIFAGDYYVFERGSDASSHLVMGKSFESIGREFLSKHNRVMEKYVELLKD